jgi:hypothetical protein
MDSRQSNDAAVDDAGVWLDVVAAVDHLSVTDRLGLTVWDAVEEAIRWWTADRLSRGTSTVSDTPSCPG